MIIIKSAAKKTLIGTLAAAALFVGGTQVAHADTLNIKSGDTVWAYSQKYHVSIDSIVKANKLADANLIVAGQSLNIPGANTADATSAATTPAATSAVATSTVASSSAVVSSSAASSSATVASSAVATSATTAASTTTSTSAATQATTTSRTQTATTSRSQASAPATSNSQAASGNWNSYLGQAYSYGNLDCSGLVQRVYGSRVKGRTTYTQQTTGAHQYGNVASAPKGALVFFGSDSAPYHVGISNGDGTFTHAPHTGDVVKVTSMKYYTPSYYVMPR